jgi:hypothetical protein
MMLKTPIQIYNELKQLDWSLVDLKMKKIDLKGNSVAEVKDEALKFLALCAVSEKVLAPGVLPDEYWHQMILDTPSYAKTVKIFGRFIHHVQNDGSSVARERDRECFWNTIQLYEETFGEPNLKVWGLEKISMSTNR